MRSAVFAYIQTVAMQRLRYMYLLFVMMIVHVNDTGPAEIKITYALVFVCMVKCPHSFLDMLFIVTHGQTPYPHTRTHFKVVFIETVFKIFYQQWKY